MPKVKVSKEAATELEEARLRGMKRNRSGWEVAL